MSISRIVILAVLCGIAMGQGEPKILINVDKLSVSAKNNDYFGNWFANITEQSPRNTCFLMVEVKKRLPDNVMVRFVATVGDKEMPEVETTLCKAIVEEVFGKPTVAQADDPVPESCPIEEGVYVFPKYVVDTSNVKPSLPTGRFSALIELYLEDEETIAAMALEGAIEKS